LGKPKYEGRGAPPPLKAESRRKANSRVQIEKGGTLGPFKTQPTVPLPPHHARSKKPAAAVGGGGGGKLPLGLVTRRLKK